MIKKKITDEVQSEVIKSNLHDTVKNSVRLDKLEATVSDLVTQINNLEKRVSVLEAGGSSSTETSPSGIVSLL